MTSKAGHSVIAIFPREASAIQNRVWRIMMNSRTQNKRIFYRALAGISLYVPCKQEEAGKPEPQMMLNEQGERFVPAFFAKRSLKGDFDEKSLVEFAFPLLRSLIGGLPQNVRGVMIEPYDKEICLDRSRMAEYDFFIKGSDDEPRRETAGRVRA